MEIKTLISIIAVVLVFLGYIPYLKDTIKGTTRPHVFSYFLWSLITLVVFGIQIKNGGGAGSYITLMLVFVIFTTFLLSLKNGKKDIKKIDYLFLVLTLLAIGLWLIIKQPLLSIILLCTIDILAFVPTVRKSWVDPYSETLSLYTITAARHTLAVIALSEITVITALFPTTWIFANALFALVLIYRRKKIPRNI